MSTKHLYPSTEGLVLKALKGSVALNASLRLNAASRVVYVAEEHIPSNQRVGVIAGGGAGHEPAHAGYTAKGMLTASVSGEVFASPSAKQVLKAIEAAAGIDDLSGGPKRDVLVVINNYTGDILNFGLAMEKARTSFMGKRGGGTGDLAQECRQVESVVVADDVALLYGGEQKSLVGPRGLAGNILICKLLGALAATGVSIQEVKRVGDVLVGNLASIGVGLERCHIPGRDLPTPSEMLGDGGYELGLGLHGERGVKRGRLGEVKGHTYGVLEEMVSKILLSPAFADGIVSQTKSEDVEVIVFVNNLGGISQLELGAVVDDLLDILSKHMPINKSVRVERLLCSSYMTSLNAPGFSVSMLNLTRAKEQLGTTPSADIRNAFDGDIVHLLDMPTEATCWGGVSKSTPARGGPPEDVFERQSQVATPNRPVAPPSAERLTADTENTLKRALFSVSKEVLACVRDLTEFDTIVGDGDCGETFQSGIVAIRDGIDRGVLLNGEQNMKQVVSHLADIVEENMGGTIGALFAIFLTALASGLPTDASISLTTWSEALDRSLVALAQYTPANVGQRTFLDALIPFCTSLREDAKTGGNISVGQVLDRAARKAEEGAEATRNMVPQLGRAVYVVSKVDVGKSVSLPPDPGAWGVAAVVRGLANGLGPTEQN